MFQSWKLHLAERLAGEFASERRYENDERQARWEPRLETAST